MKEAEGAQQDSAGPDPLSRRKVGRAPGLGESQPYPCAPSAALGGERQTAAACSAQQLNGRPLLEREGRKGLERRKEGGREAG